MAVPDFTKNLSTLRSEWEQCTACDLGVRRAKEERDFVFGEGHPRGVMFIGEGPDITDEAKGQPFASEAGAILRKSIIKLGLDRWYMTNLVTCRSCSQTYDGQGNPRYRTDRRSGITYPDIQDSPPTPTQIAACSARLYEEIYLVDPIVIVALGAEAAKALGKGAVSIMSDNATTKTILIPGAGHTPVLTEKKKLWYRKVRGKVVMPVAQNQVRYLMVPVVQPSFLMRRNRDTRHGNPIQLFAEGMRVAAGIYDRYMVETFGDRPTPRTFSEEDVKSTMEESY